jgi:monoterpene epsilon-lactone hydrolase
LRAYHENVDLPAALALLSPWCDLTNQGDSLETNDGRDPTLTRAWLNEAAKLYASAADLSQPTLSPIFASYPSEFPPVMITTGTRDLLMSQSVRLDRRLRDASVGCTIRIWDNLWHVFEYYDELPESETSLEEIAQFLSVHLNADSP